MSNKRRTCISCGNNFTGVYCNQCGEKVINTEDFKFKNLLSEAFGAITNLDSKFFRSFKLLFSNPANLSLLYIQGKRIRYMKPFQIFLFANIFFFIFLSDTDFLRMPSKWFFQENFQGINISQKVSSIATIKDISEKEVAFKYDRFSSDIAKGLLILLIPFIGIVFYILNFNKKMAFGKHLILAIHYFSTLLLVITLLYIVALLIPMPNKWYFLGPVTLLLLFYAIISMKKFYNDFLWIAFLKGSLSVFIIFFLITFYRMGSSLLSLWLL